MQEEERNSRFFSLVNYCDLNDISMVITSNMRGDELASHLGWAAWDRLMGRTPERYMIDLSGLPSYRQGRGGAL